MPIPLLNPRIAFLIALLIALCSCAPQPLYPEGTTENFPLKVAWTFEAPRSLIGLTRAASGVVVVHTNTEFISGKTTSYVIEADTGQIRWQRRGEDILTGDETSMRILGSMLILAGNDVQVYDLVTGTVWWRNTHWNGATFIDMDAETLYVASKGELAAFNPLTGHEQWRYEELPYYTLQPLYDEGTESIIIPAEEIYYIDSERGTLSEVVDLDLGCSSGLFKIRQGRIYCYARVFDAITGEELFSGRNSLRNNLWYPASQPELHILVGKGGVIPAEDMADSSLLWEYSPQALDGSRAIPITSNIVTIDSVVYAIARDATIRAVDVKTGEELGWWQAESLKHLEHAGSAWGLESDGEQLYATFGARKLYAFTP